MNDTRITFEEYINRGFGDMGISPDEIVEELAVNDCTLETFYDFWEQDILKLLYNNGFISLLPGMTCHITLIKKERLLTALTHLTEENQ